MLFLPICVELYFTVMNPRSIVKLGFYLIQQIQYLYISKHLVKFLAPAPKLFHLKNNHNNHLNVLFVKLSHNFF